MDNQHLVQCEGSTYCLEGLQTAGEVSRFLSQSVTQSFNLSFSKSSIEYNLGCGQSEVAAWPA